MGGKCISCDTFHQGIRVDIDVLVGALCICVALGKLGCLEKFIVNLDCSCLKVLSIHGRGDVRWVGCFGRVGGNVDRWILLRKRGERVGFGTFYEGGMVDIGVLVDAMRICVVGCPKFLVNSDALKQLTNAGVYTLKNCGYLKKFIMDFHRIRVKAMNIRGNL